MRGCCFLMLMMLFSVACVAQTMQLVPCPHPERTPQQEAEKHTEVMARRLQLSAWQVDTVYAIHLKYARLRRKAACRTDMIQFLEKMNQELRNVLTETQYEQYITHQRDHRPKRPYIAPQTASSEPPEEIKKDTIAEQ